MAGGRRERGHGRRPRHRPRGLRTSPRARRARPREPGRLRRSLREQDEGRGGRCTLLEEQNHCSVYAARPRTAPSVLAERHGGRGRLRGRARDLPGHPARDGRGDARGAPGLEAVAELEEVSAARRVHRPRRVPLRGGGPRPLRDGARGRLRGGEKPQAPAPEAEALPYHGGSTPARAAPSAAAATSATGASRTLSRPLRTPPRRIREIERELDYPATYAPFPRMLLDGAWASSRP